MLTDQDGLNIIKIKKQIESLTLAITESTDIHGVTYGLNAMSGSRVADSVAGYLEKLEELKIKRLGKLQELLDLEIKIEEFCDFVEKEFDNEVACVVRLRLYNGLPYSQISKILDISSETAFRKYKKALKECEKNCSQ